MKRYCIIYITHNSNIYYKINFKKQKMKLTKEQVMGIVRHSLTFIGGIVVAKGYIDNSTVTEIVGSVVTLAGAVWSIINKNK